jgi:hypothetical protein
MVPVFLRAFKNGMIRQLSMNLKSLVWSMFSGSNIKKRTFRAAFTVAACAFLVRIVFAGKKIAIARMYGRTAALDALLLA